jgi:hypothetical protein
MNIYKNRLSLFILLGLILFDLILNTTLYFEWCSFKGLMTISIVISLLTVVFTGLIILKSVKPLVSNTKEIKEIINLVIYGHLSKGVTSMNKKFEKNELKKLKAKSSLQLIQDGISKLKNLYEDL